MRTLWFNKRRNYRNSRLTVRTRYEVDYLPCKNPNSWGCGKGTRPPREVVTKDNISLKRTVGWAYVSNPHSSCGRLKAPSPVFPPSPDSVVDTYLWYRSWPRKAWGWRKLNFLKPLTILCGPNPFRTWTWYGWPWRKQQRYGRYRYRLCRHWCRSSWPWYS